MKSNTFALKYTIIILQTSLKLYQMSVALILQSVTGYWHTR